VDRRLEHILTVFLRGSLWLLLIPASLIAVAMLAAGMTFGFTLWSMPDPLPTLLWVATLVLPLLIVHSLRATRGSFSRLLFSACACWTFLGWYLVFTLR